MKSLNTLIARYLLKAILPYFIFIWLLLSVILFVQQAGRYSDILFSVNIPTNLVWQLTGALVPNVIAFTCPMAVLIGVIIGLSRMQGDSELVAIRAAGVGNRQITIPIVILGVLLSLFALFINFKGVPFAAQIVRAVAIQTAIYKLESPIEPGVFNTEVNGYTIYVKDGDFQKGEWKNIFIYSEDAKTKDMRLITSRNGRIDTKDDSSELFLENAVITTFSNNSDKAKYVSENIGQFRFAIKTKRGELVDKLSSSEKLPDELGISELSQYVKNKEGKEKIEAQVSLARRILLSITPLIFALLGTSLILRFNRGGRGFGMFLALVSLVGYYLLALLGEQLARTEKISAFIGSFLPIFVSIGLIIWFYASNRFFSLGSIDFIGKITNSVKPKTESESEKISKLSKGSSIRDLTGGILDFDIVLSLLKYLFLTLGFLSSIYLIFTAFELWKFAGTIENGVWLLSKYLLYLLPFIYIQLAPSALMISVLATYVIKSRQNEIVTWIAAGRSVYRLLLPCFLFMLAIGFANWQIQEWVLPKTNQIQDELRSQIRSRGVPTKKEGKFWVANNNRIYSFELDGNKITANPKVRNVSIYEFSDIDSTLKNIYKIPEAIWETNKIRFIGNTEKSELVNGKAVTATISNGEIIENSNPFNELYKKPNHLSISETKEQISKIEADVDKRNYAVALEKKYATLCLPLIITFFTAPFALSLSRKGKVITVGYAVAMWLFFMGTTSIFEQFGLNGIVSPAIAIWSPLILFSILGLFLLTKLKT
jgi:LPS export ABC transporter permease LptF